MAWCCVPFPFLQPHTFYQGLLGFRYNWSPSEHFCHCISQWIWTQPSKAKRYPVHFNASLTFPMFCGVVAESQNEIWWSYQPMTTTCCSITASQTVNFFKPSKSLLILSSTLLRMGHLNKEFISFFLLMEAECVRRLWAATLSSWNRLSKYFRHCALFGHKKPVTFLSWSQGSRMKRLRFPLIGNVSWVYCWCVVAMVILWSLE